MAQTNIISGDKFREVGGLREGVLMFLEGYKGAKEQKDKREMFQEALGERKRQFDKTMTHQGRMATIAEEKQRIENERWTAQKPGVEAEAAVKGYGAILAGYEAEIAEIEDGVWTKQEREDYAKAEKGLSIYNRLRDAFLSKAISLKDLKDAVKLQHQLVVAQTQGRIEDLSDAELAKEMRASLGIEANAQVMGYLRDVQERYEGSPAYDMLLSGFDSATLRHHLEGNIVGADGEVRKMTAGEVEEFGVFLGQSIDSTEAMRKSSLFQENMEAMTRDSAEVLDPDTGMPGRYSADTIQAVAALGIEGADQMRPLMDKLGKSDDKRELQLSMKLQVNNTLMEFKGTSRFYLPLVDVAGDPVVDATGKITSSGEIAPMGEMAVTLMRHINELVATDAPMRELNAAYDTFMSLIRAGDDDAFPGFMSKHGTLLRALGFPGKISGWSHLPSQDPGASLYALRPGTPGHSRPVKQVNQGGAGSSGQSGGGNVSPIPPSKATKFVNYAPGTAKNVGSDRDIETILGYAHSRAGAGEEGQNAITNMIGNTRSKRQEIYAVAKGPVDALLAGMATQAPASGKDPRLSQVQFDEIKAQLFEKVSSKVAGVNRDDFDKMLAELTDEEVGVLALWIRLGPRAPK